MNMLHNHLVSSVSELQIFAGSQSTATKESANNKAASDPAILSMISSSVTTFMQFELLLDEGKFGEAYDLLADDFEFSAQSISFRRYTFDKQQFFEDFPMLRKDKPVFDEIQTGSNDKELRIIGRKKTMMMQVTMLETWQFTDDGKILSIVVVQA